MTKSKYSSTGCDQGSGEWVCWSSFLTSTKTASLFSKSGCVLCLSTAWMLSLKNCLSDWEAALCIQTQTCGQSDIKSTCSEFRAQADTDMYSTCNNKSRKSWRLWNTGTYVQWLYSLDSTPNKVTSWNIRRDLLLTCSLLDECSIKKMVLDIVQRVRETRIPWLSV